MKKLSVLAASLTMVATQVSSQTDDDTFIVSITIENSCTITVNDLNFGTVSDLTPSIPGSTTGSVTCTGISAVDISFDPGTGGASTFATRQMDDGGGNTIDYNLYRDATFTEILGDGSGGTFLISFTSSGGTDNFDIYGQTTAGQNPKPPGTYDSTITATATF